MSDEAESYFDVLGRPICRRILRFLGERESASFKELKEGLELSVGALYYNLRLLRGLVAQDEERRYYLTERGQEALRLLLAGTALASGRMPVRSVVPAEGVLMRFFALAYASPRASLPLAVAVLALGAYLSATSGLTPMMLLFSARQAPGPLASAAFFIGGYALLALSAILSSSVISRSREGLGQLAVGSALSMLPSALFPLAYLILRSTWPGAPVWVLTAIMLLLASASLVLLTHAITVAKGMELERAALCTLLTFYLNVVLALALTWPWAGPAGSPRAP